VIGKWRKVRSTLAAMTMPVAVATAGVLVLSVPAQAQFSAGYKFLEAVRKKDGQKVTDALNEPGSQVINTKDVSSGETAMHIVTARRDVVWIEFLASRGANVNARDNKGVTPLVLAVGLGFVEGVDALIKAGARVDESNNTGETPLISATHAHDGVLARMLLKAGANPDRPDNSGRSARDYAMLDGKSNPVLSEIDNATKAAKANPAKATYGPSF